MFSLTLTQTKKDALLSTQLLAINVKQTNRFIIATFSAYDFLIIMHGKLKQSKN